MRTRFLIPLALSMALATGSARAQVFGGTYINGFPAYTLAPPVVPQSFFGTGFNLPPRFQPNSGVNVFVAPPSAYTPGPSIQFVPGYGVNYFGPYPGNGVYLPGGYTYYNYYYPADYYGNYPSNGVAAAPGPDAMPPEYAPQAVPQVNNGSNASSRTPAERRALLAAARRERDEEARVTREYNRLARAGSLAPGTLVAVRKDKAQVRYSANGSRKVGSFGKDHVYFLATTRSDGKSRVATLATAPGLKQKGERVMVALTRPVTRTRRSSTIVISNR